MSRALWLLPPLVAVTSGHELVDLARILMPGDKPIAARQVPGESLALPEPAER